MIESFRHKGLQKFFLTGDAKGIKPEHATRLRVILARLHRARNLDDLALPGLRLHQLKGQYRGFWSVSVSGNWRVIFQFVKGVVLNVDYLDYH